MIKFNDLLGKILTDIKIKNDNDVIIFTLENGDKYRLYHSQECCETVEIKDICGDLDDIINSPILLANESINNLGPKQTWTFYILSTIKGTVTISWSGYSENDCYSESVDFEKINKKCITPTQEFILYYNNYVSFIEHNIIPTYADISKDDLIIIIEKTRIYLDSLIDLQKEVI